MLHTHAFARISRPRTARRNRSLYVTQLRDENTHCAIAYIDNGIVSRVCANGIRGALLRAAIPRVSLNAAFCKVEKVEARPRFANSLKIFSSTASKHVGRLESANSTLHG